MDGSMGRQADRQIDRQTFAAAGGLEETDVSALIDVQNYILLSIDKPSRRS
jgi:hypothetical protein